MCSRIDYAILKKNPPTADDVVPLVKGTRLILAPIEYYECANELEVEEWEYLPTEFEVATTDDEELTGYMITYDENDEPIRTYGEVNLGHTPILFFGTLEDFQCSPMEYPFDEDIATEVINEMTQDHIRLVNEYKHILNERSAHLIDVNANMARLKAENALLLKENAELRKNYGAEIGKRHQLTDHLNIAVDMMDEDTQAEYHKYIKYLEEEDRQEQQEEEQEKSPRKYTSMYHIYNTTPDSD